MMVRKHQLGMWYLLSSLLFSVCLCCGPPLSSTNTREKEREQTIMREEEIFNKQRRQVDQDAGQAADVFSPLMLYYHKWRDRDGEDPIDVQKTIHSLSTPHLHQSPTPVMKGRHVGVIWNVSNISDTSNVATPSTTAAAAAAAAAVVIITSPHLVLSSSSCSSPACKWLASWQFKAVVSMTLAWLVALIALSLLTRTARGKRLLETWSSLCTLDTKDQDEVQTKGIGYFDGSPGLRRFVLIEDEKEQEEEEDNSGDLSIPEFKGVRSKGKKETESEGETSSKKWTPPRRGTYILQEASKEGVLEVGTYRLQEEEEEEEVDGKRKKKKKDKKEEEKKKEVEYILEGATYILQSERVGRGARAVREEFGHIGGIEGLYGIVGREGLRGRGGFRRIGGLGVYGIMGRGEVRGIGLEGEGYDREEEIEGLYEVLQDRAVVGGGGGRVGGGGGRVGGGGGGDDGVLLSVKELVRAVRGEKREENESEAGPSREEATQEWQEESGENETGREVRSRGTSGAKIVKETGVSNRRREEDRREVHVNDTWGGRRGGGVRSKLGGVGEGRWEGRPPPPKRAASFPMDHFLSSQIMPRKLSLIIEEEIPCIHPHPDTCPHLEDSHATAQNSKEPPHLSCEGDHLPSWDATQ